MSTFLKNPLMTLFVFLSIVGGSLLARADESTSAPPGAEKSSQSSNGQGGKESRGLYGPMNFSYMEIGELDLTPQQEKLWETAQKASEQAFEQSHVIYRNLRDQIRVDLDQPGADLKQVIQREQEARARVEETFGHARTAWVAAYDSLSADQKEQLREAIRNGMEPSQSQSMPSPPPPPPHAPAGH